MQRVNEQLRETLEIAFDSALRFRENLDAHPVAARADIDTLRTRLCKQLSDEGLPPEQVISELIADVEGGILGSAGGRFFAWVIGGSLCSALAADWLSSAWDQNAALYACGPAAAVVEEIAAEWLKELLGLPPHASVGFASGCQMAHVTCLAAARHALLRKQGWDVESRGLYGAPSIRIISSDQRHGSFERAVRLLGLGTSQMLYLPSDSNGHLEEKSLYSALLEEPAAPTIVLLQAGDINIGAFDPFDRLIPLAKDYDAWVHIDGAFGLWAAASPQYRYLVRGVEYADSWATDGHKWLNVPFDCGYAVIADSESHRASMSHRAAYITHDDTARDEIDWNPEWSRRARGFPTYAALRELGRNGIATLVERCCKRAHSLVMGIGRLETAEVLWEPVINQGLVRFLDPRPNAVEEDHDRRTDEVIAAICRTGEAFFGGTTWRGRRAMRVSVCNWQTSEPDIKRSIRTVASVLGERWT